MLLMGQRNMDGHRLSVATRPILDGPERLMTVFHHDDGSWDFLGETDYTSEDDLVTVHAQHVFDLHPEDRRELSDLPRGYLAWRGAPESRWEYEPIKPRRPPRP